jgi:hypothetical protein
VRSDKVRHRDCGSFSGSDVDECLEQGLVGVIAQLWSWMSGVPEPLTAVMTLARSAQMILSAASAGGIPPLPPYAPQPHERSAFCQVKAKHRIGLRNRERSFESCRGHWSKIRPPQVGSSPSASAAPARVPSPGTAARVSSYAG